MSIIDDLNYDLERAMDELIIQRPVLAAQNEELLRLRQALQRQAGTIREYQEQTDNHARAMDRMQAALQSAVHERERYREQYEQLRDIIQQALVQARELCQPVVFVPPGKVETLHGIPAADHVHDGAQADSYAAQPRADWRDYRICVNNHTRKTSGCVSCELLWGGNNGGVQPTATE